MKSKDICFTKLSDDQLIAEVRRLAADERQASVRPIASLIELDARRLYLGEGCSSLFTYCTQVLHLSEHAAYGRIEAARAARRFPELLDLLAEGALTLTSVGLLAPHLTLENHRELLEATRHKSKREVEQLVARLRPRPPIPSTVRKVPVRTSANSFALEMPATPAGPPAVAVSVPATSTTVVATPAAIKPLATERFKIQFMVSRETYERLRRVQDLVRHTIPNGDPAAIFDRALSLFLEHLERTKLAATARPRAGGRVSNSGLRHIPAAVRREVWKRDGGRCAFVGSQGRCGETGFLEFHHVVPFAEGGKGVSGNLEVRCRAHNAYEARLQFAVPGRCCLAR